jgi:hypothetical protein
MKIEIISTEVGSRSVYCVDAKESIHSKQVALPESRQDYPMTISHSPMTNDHLPMTNDQ